jgi:hypothetical protein
VRFIPNTPNCCRNSENEVTGNVTNKRSAGDTNYSNGNKICARCSKELDTNEEGITFKEFIYHEFCFTCGECYLPLANTNYYLKGSSIRCQEHANDTSSQQSR